MKLVLPDSRNPVKRYTGTSILYSKQFLYLFVINSRADDTKSAYNAGRTLADIRLTGYVIEMKPLTACTLYDTLCAKHHSVIRIVVEGLEYILKLLTRKLLGGLCSDGGEHLVSVVMMVMTVTTAAALLIVLVMVMLVLVAVALLIVIVVVMPVLVAMALLIVIVMVMLVLVAVALLIVIEIGRASCRERVCPTV